MLAGCLLDEEGLGLALALVENAASLALTREKPGTQQDAWDGHRLEVHKPYGEATTLQAQSRVQGAEESADPGLCHRAAARVDVAFEGGSQLCPAVVEGQAPELPHALGCSLGEVARVGGGAHGMWQRDTWKP